MSETDRDLPFRTAAPEVEETKPRAGFVGFWGLVREILTDARMFLRAVVLLVASAAVLIALTRFLAVLPWTAPVFAASTLLTLLVATAKRIVRRKRRIRSGGDGH
ncbi:hypothetical protein [Actinoplanes sp. L3-i22]|uniref:hypothetical protein n=1 Tax=Actinoplanes sp. L3-i22 TaxID=2836373 RepID=UPI001C785D36|nr:hypothetical protein [Actinoplanes sp. L3-i22]BCY07677.1 hypothetical protein L3i22_027650 [Actinoplanes sp. L3-i22]